MKKAIEIVRVALSGVHGHDLFAQGARAALEDVLKQMEQSVRLTGGTCRVCGKAADTHVRFGHKYQPTRR